MSENKMNKFFSFFKNKFTLAILAGALCNLAFAPLHFFLAAPISLSFFYFLLEKNTLRKLRIWLGFSYGFGYFLAGIYWISISLLVDAQKFAWLIPFALTLIPSVLALYFALFAGLYDFILRKFSLTRNFEKFIIFASLWLICELLRSYLFTGFPWNLLGYVWVFNDALSQAASLFGTFGLSFFAVLISLIPILFLEEKASKIKFKIPKNSDKILAIILFSLVFVSFVFGYFRLSNKNISSEKKIKIRLVQGNIKQEMKWDSNQKYLNFLKHIQLANSKDSSDIAAVILSETAVPYAIDSASELITKIESAVPNNGMLITGGLRLQESVDGNIENIWNSVFVIDQHGVLDHYDKHHLVPFGEYVPLQKYLPFVSKITDGAVGFSAGLGAKTIHTNLFSFSPLLCYEVIFPHEIIDQNDRPDLLVNLTNDAWFGNSSGPFQHFDAAKMRAVEYGISLARAANTGVTVFFDPFGRLINKINLNQEGVIDVELVKKLEPTIYSKYYWRMLILLVFFPLIFLLHKRNVTRQNHSH